jgi:circadian clock protein KaiC
MKKTSRHSQGKVVRKPQKPSVFDLAGIGRNGHSISKMPTGIAGLDEITRGGLSQKRTTLITGGPGSGKTILALQILVNGARDFGEPGIFVAFEEVSEQIVENSASFGWDLVNLKKEGIFFLDGQLKPETVQLGEFELTGLLAAIKCKADDCGARRIVFDAIDVLLAMLDNPASERRELSRLREWLSENGYVGIVTAKVDHADPEVAHQNGFIQFMVDTVIALSHRVVGRVSLRSARVVKYRGSSFAENEAPMVIGPQGIGIAGIAARQHEFVASTDRVSSGIERLDTMLNGGFYRGSGVLVTGAPGTAKSTLGCAFAEAACLRGERVLYVSFDQSSTELMRDVASVGIDLAKHVKSGLLSMSSTRSDGTSADSELLRLRLLLEERQPTCMIIDPISALIKAGGDLAALNVTEGLLHLAKAKGITTMCISLLDKSEGHSEMSQVKISSMADTWIHVSYLISAGERNRILTVVKSRGTRHSNQVREMILSKDGVTLADVYTAGGEMLMGTMRWLKESAEAAEQERMRAEVDQKRREIEMARADIMARQESLQRELGMKQAELERMIQLDAQRRQAFEKRHAEMLLKRDADNPPAHESGAHALKRGVRKQ